MNRSRRTLSLACALSAACWHQDVELGGNDTERDKPQTTDGGQQEDEPSFADECGGDAYPARGTPLELLVLLDNSATMALPALDLQCVATALTNCPQNAGGVFPTYWEIALRELRTFMSDERSAGVALALTYFGNACNPEAYATPSVPMGTLPEHALSIQQSLDITLPFADTATRPALEGAMMFVNNRARQPGYKAHPVVFMITDGFPDAEDCTDNTTQSVSQIAAAGLAASPSVMTYVFVTAAGLALDEIAAAGGTMRSLAGDLTRVGALSSALNLVRDRELSALPCAYELPSAYSGEPSRVNVTVAGKPLNNVGSSAKCSVKQGGWYYDDPESPRQILTCPSSCEQLKRSGAAEIVLGCATRARS